MKFFDYTAGAVLLTREKGKYAFRFMANETRQNDKSLNYDIVLENLRYIISKYIMEGNDISLVMIDPEFNDIKTISEPPADRKVLIDQLVTGQQPQSQTEYTSNPEPTDDDTEN